MSLGRQNTEVIHCIHSQLTLYDQSVTLMFVKNVILQVTRLIIDTVAVVLHDLMFAACTHSVCGLPL